MVEETAPGADGRRAGARGGARRPARRPRRRRHRGRGRWCCAPATCCCRPASASSRRWACRRSTSYARPRVAIVSTGNEVVAPGTAARARADLRREPPHALGHRRGARRRWRCRSTWPPTRSTRSTRRSTSPLGCDLIVFSGGSSVGDRDLVLDVLTRRGTVVFHGIATRPGKPTAFGRIGERARVRHARQSHVVPDERLRAARAVPAPAGPPAGASAARVTAPLTRRVASSLGRHQFYTVRLVAGHAEPAFKASGDITSMAHADGYIEIRARRGRGRGRRDSWTSCSSDRGVGPRRSGIRSSTSDSSHAVNEAVAGKHGAHHVAPSHAPRIARAASTSARPAT